MTTIEVMRKALEALTFDGFCPEDATHRYYTTQAITALRAEIARLEAVEPVAWLHPSNASCVTTDPTAYARGIPLYAANKAQDMSEESTQAWEAAIPDGRATDQWDSGRVYDYNAGWNDCREAVKAALPKLYTAPIAPTPPAAIPALNPIEYELAGELPDKTSWAIIAHWAYALAAERAGVRIK